jgi:hypothetical protein
MLNKNGGEIGLADSHFSNKKNTAAKTSQPIFGVKFFPSLSHLLFPFCFLLSLFFVPLL